MAAASRHTACTASAVFYAHDSPTTADPSRSTPIPIGAKLSTHISIAIPAIFDSAALYSRSFLHGADDSGNDANLHVIPAASRLLQSAGS